MSMHQDQFAGQCSGLIDVMASLLQQVLSAACMSFHTTQLSTFNTLESRCFCYAAPSHRQLCTGVLSLPASTADLSLMSSSTAMPCTFQPVKQCNSSHYLGLYQQCIACVQGSTQGHWRFPEQGWEQGLAYLMTHPGTPCVFYDDLQDPAKKALVQKLIAFRQKAGVNCRSQVGHRS